MKLNENKRVRLKINGMKYMMEDSTVKGRQLKVLANLPFEEKLVLNINNKPDIEFVNDKEYEIKDGMKFYSSTYVPKIIIEVDGKEYELNRDEMSGKELKQLADIPLNGYKLIKEVRNGQDIHLEDNRLYDIDKKDIFFAVPTGINNGGR